MITLVPVGGMANRLWSMASGISLAHACHTPLRIVWFKDQGLNCDFKQLFRPIQDERAALQEGGLCDMLRFDRPRRKNLCFPRLWQKAAFAHCMYEEDERLLMEHHFDFPQWVGKRDAYIASYRRFFPYPPTSCSTLFHPIEEIATRIDRVTSDFTPQTIGIHLRRTDHIYSIEESPLSLFIKTIEKEIEANDRINFYLATDSQEDKQRLKKQFGSRILTYDCELSRNSLEGMQAGVVELWALSRTAKIIGSHRSTYSQLAAELSGIECQMIRKNEKK